MKKFDIHNSRILIYLLLTLSSVFWGVSFIFTKELFLTEPHLGVTTLIALRLAVASAVMFPLLALTHQLQPIRRGDLKWFLLLALCEPFIYHLCETNGVRLVSGSLASVIIATIPLFVPFGMWVAYRTRISLAMIIGVVLSLVGVVLMIYSASGDNAPFSFFNFHPQGLLFLAGAVTIAVVYTLLLVKIVDHYNPVVITTYQNLIGLVYFLPLALAFDHGSVLLLSWSPKMMMLILALGILCSTVAYACYNVGIRCLGASQASIFNNTIPIFSLIAAILLAQESFSWLKLVGIVIVIAGVIIAQR